MPSIVAVIPAKSMSNRIRGKNFRDMAGKPLYRRAVDTCLESSAFETVYVSSDENLSDTGVRTHHRTDPVQMEGPSSDCLRYVMEAFYANPFTRPEWFCLVQPTSPCLESCTLYWASEMCAEDVDMIIACRAGWREPCGAFYFVRSHLVAEPKPLSEMINVYSGRLLWYPIPSDEAIDVDCHADWKLAELILRDRERETV